MAVTWTGVRDSLTTAATTALASDKAAALTLRDRLNSLGAAYDAAVAAGTFQPSSAPTAAAIGGAQRANAWAASLRAVARLEDLIPPASRVFISSDPFSFDGTGVAAAAAGLYVDRNGVASANYTGFRVVAKFGGVAGHGISVRFTLTGGPDGGRGLEERFNGRLIRTVGFGRGENGQVKAFGHLIDATAQWLPTADMPSPVALAGGAGDDPSAMALRAALAKGRAAAVINGTNPTTAATARTAVARLDALLNELQTAFSGGNAPAPSAAPATVPTALELQLGAALDEGRALLSYLGA
jgi:hypothetical protein